MDRTTLATKVYEAAIRSCESFEEQDIGADLAYLLGAILKGGRCEWPADRPILEVLAREFGERHPVWRHVVRTAPERGRTPAETAALHDRLYAKYRREARGACRFRGHDMARFSVLSVSAASIMGESRCRKCGMSVRVQTAPPPNWAELVGEALALTCPGKWPRDLAAGKRA